MRFVVALLCLVALVGCSSAPPAYESTYTPPAAAPAAAPPPPPATFVDTFDHPDGSLGNGWDLRGPWAGSFPMPPATDGFIRDGRYTYAGDAIVYASREFPETVKRVGAIGRWREARPGAETSIALVISANDNLVSDMVHLVVSRYVWTLTVRRSSNGAFEPVADGKFTTPLAPGRDYSFELTAQDDTVTVTVPGQPPTVRPVPLAGLVGPHAFWEEFADPLPAGMVFDFDSVWAD